MPVTDTLERAINHDPTPIALHPFNGGRALIEIERVSDEAVEAHREADRLQSSGTPCYVRRWHLGQRGWWVVHPETYERLNVPRSVATMPAQSTCNRGALRQFRVAGCFYCCHVSLAAAVFEWVHDGQTALCPRCGVDALLPGQTDPAVLAAGLEHWFPGKSTAAIR